jgi:hypothetical protein
VALSFHGWDHFFVCLFARHDRRFVSGKPWAKFTVAVHGHYRDAAVAPLTARPIPTGDVKLAYIGQVRPYKNLEVLVDAATGVSGLQLLVCGMGIGRSIGDALLARAG